MDLPARDGHLQATGRDARGRKQYRYHADWQALRGDDKFEPARSLRPRAAGDPRAVGRDLRPAAGGTPGVVTRRLVLASVVRLLDTTFVRIGNEEYARENRSYGLTTLRNRHAGVSRRDAAAALSRQERRDAARSSCDDRRVAAVVRRCRRLPGQELFQYEDDDGAVHRIDSGDVNEYLADAAGGAFTAKDFRTWHGSVLALELTRLACGRPADAEADGGAARFSAQAVLAQVAQRLGNTPAVCRKAYVHPAVLELGNRLAADAAEMAALRRRRGRRRVRRRAAASAPPSAVSMAFLRSARSGAGRRGRQAQAGIDEAAAGRPAADVVVHATDAVGRGPPLRRPVGIPRRTRPPRRHCARRPPGAATASGRRSPAAKRRRSPRRRASTGRRGRRTRRHPTCA